MDDRRLSPSTRRRLAIRADLRARRRLLAQVAELWRKGCNASGAVAELARVNARLREMTGMEHVQ